MQILLLRRYEIFDLFLVAITNIVVLGLVCVWLCHLCLAMTLENVSVFAPEKGPDLHGILLSSNQTNS